MVAPENDDGVRAQIEAIKFREHATDVGVHVGTRGEVSADGFPGGVRRGIAGDKQVGVLRTNGLFGETFRHGRARREIHGQRDVRKIVEVIKLLRRTLRAMRLGETAGEEKWLVFIFGELRDGAGRDAVIVVALAVAFINHPAVGTTRGLVGVLVDKFGISVRFRRAVGDAIARGDNFCGTTLGAFQSVSFTANSGEKTRLAAFIPRVGVINAVVENFPGTSGDVAMIFEPARQRDEFRMRVTNPSAIAEHARHGRFVTGEQRSARGTTERILRVGAVEPHAGGGELVEVGRDGCAAVAAEFRAQIVGDDEEDVELGRGRVGHTGGQTRGGQNSECEQWKKFFHAMRAA